jgi:hypothetical protein
MFHDYIELAFSKADWIFSGIFIRKIWISDDINNRNKRDLLTPSGDVRMKISDNLAVSVDNLVGKTKCTYEQKIN